MQADNLPRWNKERSGFYEVWYLKLNLVDPKQRSALWLRFTTLSQKSGLKKIAETWAIFFEPQAGGGSNKLALKNTGSMSAYETKSDGSVHIEDSVFRDGRTRGCVASRGHKIEWDLSYEPNSFTFFPVPRSLQKLGLTKSIVCKPNMDIRFNGSFTVDGRRFDCAAAPGCQGHIWGKRYAHDWAWTHCNLFDDGSPKAVLEALTARVRIGGLVTSPQMSALFLEYKGDRYELNSLLEAFTIRSKYSLTHWQFAAEKKDLRLVGEVTCDVKDLVGVTYEDTQGSFLYCQNSELASMNLSVYYRGKLDASLRSTQAAAFETVSRARSPYVEVLL